MEPAGRGRARGRARGRTVPLPLEQSQQPQPPAPGAAAPPAAQSPIPAVGRGRGPSHPQAGPSSCSQPVAAPRQAIPTDKNVLRTRCIENKKGTSGQNISLLSNFFEVSSLPNFSFFQYHVSFEPEVERIGERRSMLRSHDNILKGFLFDGGSLFSTFRYQPCPLQLLSKNVNGEKVVITFKFATELQNTSSNFNQLLNIIAKKCLRYMGLVRIGRDYYDARERIPVPEFGLEIWPGYATSIRQHESQVLMNSAITCKVLRQETVLNTMENMHRQYQQNFKEPLKQAILGSIVMTDYNNRTYRIDDIDFDVTPMTKFSVKDNSETTFVDYYLRKYQIKIKNVQQPLLVTKVKSLLPGTLESIYLIPELCRLTGLTDEMRSNYQLMAAIAKYTRMDPQRRIAALMNFGQRLMHQQEIGDELKKWDMSFKPQLVETRGRVIPMEMIVQGTQEREVRYESGRNVDWTANLRSNALLIGGRMDRWVAIIPRQMGREGRQFIEQILRAARGMSMQMSPPNIYDVHDDSLGAYVNAIEDILSRNVPDILVCMVSNNRSDRYAAIKKKCCVERAVPTQVITRRSMTNKSAMSIATKISIQMNCKVGGAPWSCVNPLRGVMVCGFDATHDTVNKGNSFGAFVASLNDTFTRYFSIPFAHPRGSDISNNMAHAMEMAISKFRKHNEGSLPSRIIIYRDGVGDGQINFVLNIEVEVIKSALERLYRGQNYKLAFVIVSKRINTKFFVANNRQNPPPGTVIDDVVTWPERYDFFLVSQSVRQGTVSPTSYNVIFDNTGLDPDKMQRFTYKMTHLYYNWSGTIKVPAPVQYAHKLCDLVGQHLHKAPLPDLDEHLYFL